jgi:hypothetical protein
MVAGYILVGLLGAAAATCIFLPVFDVLTALGLATLIGNAFVLGCAVVYAIKNREEAP